MVRTLAGRLWLHPPFDRLPAPAVEQMAAAMHVRYVDSNETLFREGEAARGEVYLIHKGGLRLTRSEELVAMCEPGDLVGLRAHLGERPYSATATTTSDCLIYSWPAPRFLAWIRELPELATHLATGFAAEGALLRERGPELALPEQAHSVEPSRNLLTCGPEATVRDAAAAMAERRVGSILVLDEQRRPLGIVTDVDLRTRIVALGRDPSETRVAAIMSQPVVTIRDAPSVAEATVAMVQRGIHHLVTTVDGSDASEATGLIADHDLLVASGEQPAALARALKRATRDEQLRELRERLEGVLSAYLEASLAVDFVARIATAVTDQLTRRAVALAIDALGPPPARFAWLGLGSQGRGEQILRTDQDNALVFEAGPHRDYFLALAEHTVARLEAAGFERCPAQMMASNRQWCGDLEHWRAVFSRWIKVPEQEALLHASIFFDFRAIAGEPALAHRLREHVVATVAREGRFLPMLANSALHNPAPLSLFRNFVLERSGEHRNEFDLKARAMMPLADAARVLSLELALSEVGTQARYRGAARLEPQLADTCTSAAAAYTTLMDVRTRQGLRRGTSGRFVDIESLSSLDRQRLRHAFSALDRVQKLLTVRYQTDVIR